MISDSCSNQVDEPLATRGLARPLNAVTADNSLDRVAAFPGALAGHPNGMAHPGSATASASEA